MYKEEKSMYKNNSNPTRRTREIFGNSFRVCSQQIYNKRREDSSYPAMGEFVGNAERIVKWARKNYKAVADCKYSIINYFLFIFFY